MIQNQKIRTKTVELKSKNTGYKICQRDRVANHTKEFNYQKKKCIKK